MTYLLPCLIQGQIDHYVVNASCDQSDFLFDDQNSDCSYFSFSFLGENYTIESYTTGPQTDPFGDPVYVGPAQICIGQPSNTAAFQIIQNNPFYSLNEEISDSQNLGEAYCPAIEYYDFGMPIGSPPSWTFYADMNRYVGIVLPINGDFHFGWMKFEWANNFAFGTTLVEIAIENTPNLPILAGSTISLNSPYSLNQSYTMNPDGIYLNWIPIANAQACQVRGGPAGGSDPHNFIISTPPYNQLFINGNSLTIGQEYQWKVRCATGINPYSGITPWSEYDYFTYQP